MTSIVLRLFEVFVFCTVVLMFRLVTIVHFNKNLLYLAVVKLYGYNIVQQANCKLRCIYISL